MRSCVNPRARGSVAFAATTGGHLVQMKMLAPKLVRPGQAQAWITHDSPQSRALLADETVLYTSMIPARRFDIAMQAVPGVLRFLRRQRVGRVYSTGASIAAAALPFAFLVGARATYIESLARPEGPSVTGRLMALIPWVAVRTQYERNENRRWKYRGTLLDSFEAAPRPVATGPKKILVTLGTAGPWGFPALLEKVDSIIPPDVEIVWQTGHTNAAPERGRIIKFVNGDDFVGLVRWADVVISHAGCGSLLTCLDSGKIPVLVPRRAHRSEHVDDHQTQIADVAAGRGLAIHLDVDEVSWEAIVEAHERMSVPVVEHSEGS